MDAGTYSISSEKSHAAAAAAPRPPLQEAGPRPYMPSLSTGSRNPSAKCYGDRFIPDRSAMDMDVCAFTGACLNSVDTGSQVCALLWNKNERELLSSHGFTQNQLTLWKYPSMVKMAELTGHTSRVLFMAQSPDGCTVASAAADETLRFWNVFGAPEAPKPAAKASHTGMFNSFNHIR